MKKIIFTGFSPNLTGRDVLVALKFLCLPWKWFTLLDDCGPIGFSLINGKYIKIAEEKLKQYFKIKYAYTFDSGRSALYFALKSLRAGEGDEILTQAYTCVVVPNAICQTGAKPVYVDICNDFNMDPEDLEKKITHKSKILIIQHTFGLPAQLGKLLLIAKKYNLKVVEDCAHSFGAKYNGQFVGTFGDIGMFSFGADKTISCVRGGALITKNSELADKIKQYQNNLPLPLMSKTIQHLLHYPLFFVGKPLYGIKIGKVLLYIAKKFNIINHIIYKPEKSGHPVPFYPARLANALAQILINQLQEVDEINDHRRRIAKLYTNFVHNKKVRHPTSDIRHPKLRYTILTKHPRKMHDYAKKHGIILGNWYNTVIAPADIDLEKTGYKKGDCPNAELLASQSINLPTNRCTTEKDAKRIVKVINQFNRPVA